MTTADALIFLRRKLTFIVQCTCDPDDRKALQASWEPIFAAIPSDGKLAALQKLDRELEKALERFVFDWDIDELRQKLVEGFGLSRLVKAEIEQAAVPPPSPDDVILTPSGKKRPVKRRYRDWQGREQESIDTSAATIQEFAQLYSDYAGRQVRLAGKLAERKIPPGTMPPGYEEADASEVIAALRCHFERLHVFAVNDGAGIVFKDVSARDAALAEANQPKQAAADEIQRAAGAMSVDRFWEMIGAAGKRGEGLTVAQLEAALNRCTRDEILGFQLRLEECLAASYRLDLWAVAYIVRGGCSDDGFEYFRGWLISQGRAYFETALGDPERAADRAADGEVECEEILYVAQTAFARKSKKPMPRALTARPPHAIGTDWNEEDLPTLFPRLTKKFSGRHGGDGLDLE